MNWFKITQKEKEALKDGAEFLVNLKDENSLLVLKLKLKTHLFAKGYSIGEVNYAICNLLN